MFNSIRNQWQKYKYQNTTIWLFEQQNSSFILDTNLTVEFLLDI